MTLAIIFTILLLLGASWATIRELTGWGRAIYQIALWGALIGAWGLSIEMMGYAKPSVLELSKRSTEESRVISAFIHENEAIYIWMVLPGEKEPRAYKYPYSLEMAKELYEALTEAGESGQGMLMGHPFDSTDGTEEQMFYPDPVPSSPNKQIPNNQPMVIQ